MLAGQVAVVVLALHFDDELGDVGGQRQARRDAGAARRTGFFGGAPMREAQRQVAGGAALAHQQFVAGRLVAAVRGRRHAFIAAIHDHGAA
jgi:hypothetical protein